ncbi:MAG: NAD-dependent DNA ligase LigA [Bacteroidaceae bacterium]|nr:NAD-dependent DNA ligase LigA [Bacteroidaceae bacterium]
MTAKEQIESLREELNRHNYNYYVLNSPTISDYEFDTKMRLLQDLEKANPDLFDPNSPTQRVGSDLTNTFVSVTHARPMLSLANTYSQAEVEDFYRRVAQGLQGEPFEICCELKFDGLSISLIYHEGRLVRAVTRGDGVQGDDVTANVRTIQSVPLVLMPGLNWPSDFEIRGEILLPWTSFERLNKEREAAEEPLFANPRNAASGTLKLQNSAEVARRGLDAYLYYLLCDDLPADGHYENLQLARKWGFKISESMRKCQTLEQVMEFINYWDVERKNLPVATDGVVLKVNSVSQQERLGYTAKVPRWAIAYKFKAEQALTRLASVSFQVGRQGTVTPVANFDAVQLSGTMVRRATLHNADFVEKLDLHIGDMVYVEKGGEIIPKITAVDTDSRDASLGEKVQMVTRCPECGTPLVREEGEAAWYCPNDTTCPPQVKGRIEHFVSRKAMNIDGLGGETIDLLYNARLIRDVADLYQLRAADICRLERMGQKSAANIVHGIEDSKKVPFERVLFAIGIRFVGETTAKMLARAFGSMDALSSATMEQLVQVDEIGEKIAASVIRFFGNEVNRMLVERLRAVGLQFEVQDKQQETGSDALKGKSIVISGVFKHHSRDEYKALIEQHGGINVSSISAKTSFVFAGENMGPAKLEKARQLGIPIVGETEFLQMIGEPIPQSGELLLLF